MCPKLHLGGPNSYQTATQGRFGYQNQGKVVEMDRLEVPKSIQVCQQSVPGATQTEPGRRINGFWEAKEVQKVSKPRSKLEKMKAKD